MYWLGEAPRFSAAQAVVMQQATPAQPPWVTDISLWEIATLYTLGRLTFDPLYRCGWKRRLPRPSGNA